MLIHLLPLLKLVAAAALVLLLIDAAIFRSGAYAPWIEPNSTAGSVVGARLAMDRANWRRSPALPIPSTKLFGQDDAKIPFVYFQF